MADLTDLTRFTSGSIADRQARLPGPLRGLYRAVLRRFLATGHRRPPSGYGRPPPKPGWTPPPWTTCPPPTLCTSVMAW
jgi:hypothetical protein